MNRFYFSKLIFLVVLLSGLNWRAIAQTTTTFNPTGSVQMYTVPLGCNAVNVDVAGAQGGSYSSPNVLGGKGGRVQATIAVTPNQVLYVYVGAQPAIVSYCSSNPGGAADGGGGQGGNPGTGCGGQGGGGASDVRTVPYSSGATVSLNSRLVVGAGGGGAAYDCYGGDFGGQGGGATGGQGYDCSSSSYLGFGGTQTSGGAAGSSSSPGGWGNGGNGYCCNYGGGGGGGYYGGGGSYAGGGGGGSSYPLTGATATTSPAAGVVTGITNSAGAQNGNGYVLITPIIPVLTATPSSITFGPTLVGTTSVPALFSRLTGVNMGASPLHVNISGAGFTIATDDNPTFSTATHDITYTPPTIGTAANRNIYVQFTPTAASSFSGTITVTGGGLGSPVVIPVSGTGATLCTGTPIAGTTVATPTTGNIYTPFTLSLTPAPGNAGYTYQWQSATALAGPYTNISGAVLSTYSFTGISATTYFQCIVTCTGSGSSATSSPVQVSPAGLTTPGCTPTAANGYCCGFSIGEPGASAFTVQGILGTMTDAFVTSGTTLYHDFSSSLNVTLAPNTTPTVHIGSTTGLSPNPMNVQLWIDWNNDGTFQTSETIGGGPVPANTQASPLVTIPANVLPGVYRLRVVLDYASGNPANPSIPPCPTTAISYADTRDYTVIIAPANCSGATPDGIVSATALSACAPPLSFTPTLINVGAVQASGITYNWQSSPDGTTWSNVGGATGTVFTPTITSLGVTYYRNSATCAFGSTGYSAPISVSLNPLPTPITPTTANLCLGVPFNLISTPSGGTWTSANTSVATVGSTSGTVTGSSLGQVLISYSLPTGCTVTNTVTVNAQPAPIVGPSAVCQNSSVTYSDPSPSGVWTSSTPTVGTIGAATGFFTGNASGTTNVVYTNTVTSCSSSMAVTVNGLPTLFIVAGGGGYCVGSASPYSVTLNASQIGVTYQLLLAGSPAGLPALSGTGAPLNFGIQSAPGNYTVVATNNITGCTRTMVGSATIVLNTLPLQYSVSGGGSYCSGSLASAPHIFLSGSQSGINYRLMLGTSVVLTLPGSGGALDFGPQPSAGCYTVVAFNPVTTCQIAQLGSSCVTINSLPTAFNILPAGGASYCIGGSGVDVQLDFSNTGITYQLFNSGILVSTLSGTGGLLDFGVQAAAGTYTIVGTNVTTGCVASMAGASAIAVNPLPTPHNVTTAAGGSSGSYCAGDIGVDIVMDASDGGVNYQLYDGIIPVGLPIGGTGTPLDFGYQTGAGNYTVVATDATTLCTNNMAGTVAIGINPLPPLATVTGGGNFCIGGPGVHIGINPTVSGISYQLMMGGIPVGAAMNGTGGALDFGIFNTVGIYTVVATNSVTGCTRTMSGVSTISTNPLPFAFNVTGGGNYCSGSTGLPVGLDFSATGITYQLMRGGVAVGTPVSGTGAPITFGIQTVSGTYTVVGTNVSTSCSSNMAGSAVLGINSLPNLHLVTGGGNFCVGDTGRHIVLNGSEAGNTYQLFVTGTPVGSAVAGTGSLIDFGLQTVGGTYTIVAVNSTTGCMRYMTGGAPVNVYPLPDVFTVAGGGVYCAGTPGVHVGLTGSVSGIKYQLYIDGGASGLPLAGTGGAIDFGVQLAAGTYTVGAMNPITGCTNNMSGSVNVATSPLPVVFTVTGGGNFCAGGTGSSIGLSSSETSVNYQLYHGTTPVGSAMPGTGSAIDFGPTTTTGIYTVVASDATTACSSNMMGSVTVGINPLPTAYSVSGGGNYCAGGAGFHIFLAGSASGVSYQLFQDTTMLGTAMSGTGAAVDFGLQTGGGSYTVIATNATTGCIRTMSGAASINVYPLPVAHTLTGGGSYCAGGTGVNVGLDGSNFGTTYQLYHSGTPVGVTVPGTGSNINFGLHTAAGTYTVVAVNSATTCTNGMTGTATIVVNPLPATFAVTGGGSYCATGLGVHVNLSGSESGVNYQLWNGPSPVGIPVPGSGSALDFGLQTLAGDYSVTAVNQTTTCGNNMTGTSSVSILPVLLPHADITSSVSGLACVGQLVNFTATPVNGGTAPTFQWFVNTVATSVLGTSFSYSPVDGDVVSVQITSNYPCAIPTTGSGTMTMTVSPPEMPSASVAVYPGTQICTGGTASFTATTHYGGTAPTLLWIKNGAFVGSGSSYSYVPTNGDIVTFMLGSNFPCRLVDTVFSANTILSVQTPSVPVVSISSNPGVNLTTGQSVTFTATVVHGGSSPLYQWVVNSTPVVGATNSTYTTNTLADKDSVSVMVDGSCGLVGFNSVGVHVHTAGVGVTNVTGNSNLVLVPNPNKGDFTVKGTLASVTDQEVVMEVTDMIGQVVYSNKVNSNAGNINEHIQLKNLANGMYLMNLRAGDEKAVFHFVIEQ